MMAVLLIVKTIIFCPVTSVLDNVPAILTPQGFNLEHAHSSTNSPSGFFAAKALLWPVLRCNTNNFYELTNK